MIEGPPLLTPRRYAIEPARLGQELGWQPQLGFEVGLALTVR
ncbi:MAG: hypothetical protein WAM11_02205 [Cyanobium sp.]